MQVAMQITTSLSFVGREAERVAIRERMTQPECRLLTITGAGGVGKTRLAQEIAGEPTRNGQRVIFVPLAEVHDEDGIYAAIAAALDLIADNEQDIRDRVFAALQTGSSLLILDNYEQLVSYRQPIRDLLDNTPNVRILLTSRERVNMRDEWVIRLDGLPVHTDAMRLFADRARQIAPEFDAEREAGHIAAICKAVEGLPLAIELAASWLPVMQVGAVADEIANNLSQLKSPYLDVNARHASLEAVFEGTWRLLTPDQAEQFKRLSVFRGGFNRIAAEAVAKTSLDDLRTFTDKSLIRHDGRGRYHMHELLRQFADSKLSADERTNAEASHGDFTLFTLKRAEISLKGAEQVAALDSIEDDFANIERAWRNALDDGKWSLLADAAESLRLLAIMRSRVADVRRMYEMALDPHSLTLPPYTIQKIRLRWLFLRDWERAIEEEHTDAAVESCYVAANANQDMNEASFARRVQGHIAFGKAAYAEARGRFEEAMRILDSTSPTHEQMELLRMIGHTYLFNNQSAESLPYYRDSLKIAEEIGDRIGAAVAWMGIGGAMRDVGDYEGTYQAHYAAYQLQKATQNWGRYAWNLTNLAEAAFRRGDVYMAAKHLSEAHEAAARTEGQTPGGYREYLQALIDEKLREFEAIRSSLSPREVEVMRLMTEGLSNAQIAERLVIETGTVKLHVHNILKKLGAENRTHAAALANTMRI